MRKNIINIFFLLLSYGLSQNIHTEYLILNGDSVDVFSYQIPENYDNSNNHPLLVVFHQWGGDENSPYFTQFDEEANNRNWLYLSPFGGSANNYNHQTAQHFVMQEILWMSEQFNIDKKHWRVIGHYFDEIRDETMGIKPDGYADRSRKELQKILFKVIKEGKLTEMNEPWFEITYKDSRGRKKTDSMRAKNPKEAKKDFVNLMKGRGFKVLKVVKEGKLTEATDSYVVWSPLLNKVYDGPVSEKEALRLVKKYSKQGQYHVGMQGTKYYNKTKLGKKNPIKEGVEPTGGMAKIAAIVKNKQHGKVGGQTVDMQSANLLMKLYNAVKDTDKEKMNKINEKKLIMVLNKLWSRVKLKLPV